MAGGRHGLQERGEHRDHKSAPYTHPHPHAHTKLGALRLMAETQQDRARPTAAGYEHYPAHEDQADGPSSAALSQAGVMGPGPATRYKIKNISNIQ